MKSIATVNTTLPTAGNHIGYLSGESLRDHDLVLFDPEFPHMERIHFDAGGSCLSIEATRGIQSAISHWSAELKEALKAGKTVFVILSEEENDMGANGSTLDKKQRTYHTFNINNYEALPTKVSVRNTKGKQILVADGAYRGLYDALTEVAQYRVILDPLVGKKIFTAKDGTAIASIVGFKELAGKMVLLPHFNLTEYDKSKTNKWLKKTLEISQRLVGQLVTIDDFVRRENNQTPPPEWLVAVETPAEILNIEDAVRKIDGKIETLKKEKDEKLKSKESLLEFTLLLYENGKSLELAVERSLNLLGYKVENYRAGDLEIDHIITSPEGLRMVGESEGKDTSAVDISKFRQLESNISEDFQRDDVKAPAKGILFGNGFRFTTPDERGEQFTAKCLTNAKRLGTALVRTADLYKVVLYILNHPEDQVFKVACRGALEKTTGEIVSFPSSISQTLGE